MKVRQFRFNLSENFEFPLLLSMLNDYINALAPDDPNAVWCRQVKDKILYHSCVVDKEPHKDRKNPFEVPFNDSGQFPDSD